MILSGTLQDLPLNLQPRVESDIMRLYEYLEDPENKLYFVQGIVPHGIAPLIQPPKEVDQQTEVSTNQEALISFFTNERGADRFRSKLVKKLGYKDGQLTVTALPVKDFMDLVSEIDAQFNADFGISLRSEVYYVRNDTVVAGDVFNSEFMLKN